jgi:hypothetical protein
MPYTTWQEAAAVLKRRCAPADDEQRELARKLGLKLPQRVPALVAAALIKEHLAGPLRLDSADAPSGAQEEYLHD